MTALFLLPPPSLQARDWLSAPSAAPETSQRPTPARRPAGPPALPGGEGHLAQALCRARTATILRPSLEAKNPKDTTSGSPQFRAFLETTHRNLPNRPRLST